MRWLRFLPHHRGSSGGIPGTSFPAKTDFLHLLPLFAMFAVAGIVLWFLIRK